MGDPEQEAANIEFGGGVLKTWRWEIVFRCRYQISWTPGHSLNKSAMQSHKKAQTKWRGRVPSKVETEFHLAKKGDQL